MLGGSVWIALLRFVISFSGTTLLFSLMSESRFERKKAIACYAGFSMIVIAAACVWYGADWESCVKMVAFVSYMCFGFFPFI